MGGRGGGGRRAGWGAATVQLESDVGCLGASSTMNGFIQYQLVRFTPLYYHRYSDSRSTNIYILSNL